MNTRFHQVPAVLWPCKDARTHKSTLEHWDDAKGVSPDTGALHVHYLTPSCDRSDESVRQRCNRRPCSESESYRFL